MTCSFANGLITFLVLASTAPAQKTGNFEGTLTLAETRDGVVTQTIYTRKGDELRLDNPDKSKPEPINIIDLAAQKLTIIYPHNSSFVQVDLAKAETQTGTPNLPPGFSASSNMNQLGAGAPAGRSLSPPPILQIPNHSMASGMPSRPIMPATIGFGAALELKKTDKTKKIQGFECTCYTISSRMEIFEIWATNDSALFPFHLLQMNYLSRHFGPQMLEDQWVELLQKKSLFPVEAILRPEKAGPERLSFKVTQIDPKKIDREELFKVPENYYEINARPF